MGAARPGEETVLTRARRIEPMHSVNNGPAVGADGGAAILTRCADTDEAPVEDVDIALSGLPDGARVSWFLLDGTKDMEKVREDRVYGGKIGTIAPMKLFDTLPVRVEKLYKETKKGALRHLQSALSLYIGVISLRRASRAGRPACPVGCR